MPLMRSAVDTPNLLHRELRVSSSAAQDSITPPTNKRLKFYGAQCSMLVTASLSATLRGTLAFGTGHTTDPDKILASCRITAGDDAAAVFLCGVTAIGDVNETLTLTNTTFSVGNVITRAVVYYETKN